MSGAGSSCPFCTLEAVAALPRGIVPLVTFSDGWIGQACWEPNRDQDPVCGGSVLVFGGAGAAAIAGLVLTFIRRERRI